METKERIHFFLLFCAGAAATAAGDLLRSYGINNTFTDVLPNYARPIAVGNGLLAILNEVKRSDLTNINLLTTGAYLATEIGQRYHILPGVFDEKDIIAYIGGGITSVLMGLYVKREQKF